MGAADSSSMLHFQKLDVYQRSIEFLALAHRVRERLPRGHANLADQLRRAAQSVPQNIAEGCGRTTRADKARHYAIARGSAMDAEDPDLAHGVVPAHERGHDHGLR